MKKLTVLMLVLGMASLAWAEPIELRIVSQDGNNYHLAIQLLAPYTCDAYSFSVTVTGGTLFDNAGTVSYLCDIDIIYYLGIWPPNHMQEISCINLLGDWGPGPVDLIWDFGVTVDSGSATVYLGPGSDVTRVDPGGIIVPEHSLLIYARPACWDYDTFCYGDSDDDNDLDFIDLLTWKDSYNPGGVHPDWNSPHGTGIGQYNPCADFNQDGTINFLDALTWKDAYVGADLVKGTADDCYQEPQDLVGRCGVCSPNPWPPPGFP